MGQPARPEGGLPPSLGCSPDSPRPTVPKQTPKRWPHRTPFDLCPPLPRRFTIKLNSLRLLHTLAEENEFFVAQHGPKTLIDLLVGQTLRYAPDFLGPTLVKERERCLGRSCLPQASVDVFFLAEDSG